jgi:1-acyl-sn-glycerol-3-phosphate acyltransferase
MRSGEPDPETGVTVELSAERIRAGLPARTDDLRDALPGLEPDRHVTDWGRSERIERLVDRTLYDFLYHYWFRVDVEGIENVPASGGAMLVANHGGALPPDAIMIAKAITEEHPQPRPLHLTTDRVFGALPGLGMFLTKVGGVVAHPANVHRLLFDEQQLVLVFPEGRHGPAKPVSERYRLRRFGRGGFVESALRARVPIVPVAVVGSEEAMPLITRVNPLRRLTRLPFVPVTTGLPLPAKFKIRFLEPVRTDQDSDQNEAPWNDSDRVRTLGHDIRALIQENLLEMVAQRRSVWLG